jgi:PAS domain S-box-containing protein
MPFTLPDDDAFVPERRGELEQRVAEQRVALRENERRLAAEVAGARTLHDISTRLIVESTQEALFSQIVDAAAALMVSDAASVQMLGADGESLNLLAWKNFHPESAAFWRRVSVGSASTCGQALHAQSRVVVSDIETCSVLEGSQDQQEYRRSRIRSVQSTPLRSRSGRPLGMLSTHWQVPHTPSEDDFRLFDVLARQAADLIERGRTEDALRESEERFRLMANSAPVSIWLADPGKRCIYVNQLWINLTGRPFEDALGDGWLRSLHPDDVERIGSGLDAIWERRERFQVEYRVMRHDGDFRWVIDTGVPRYTGDGTFAGYVGSAVDVTERKLAEAAVSSVSQRLLDAQEEERAHLARELHDDINQRLSLLHLRLDAIASMMPEPSDGSHSLDEARDEVAGLVKDVHDLSHRLHPQRLEYLGMAAAASALCDEMAVQHAVAISFHAAPIPDDLSMRGALCLYRVLQEALRNAVKHSGAGAIDVRLDREDDRITLTVQDRGRGFDLESKRGVGLGLISMKERLHAVDGELAIDSRPQQGTVILARVPLRQR